MRLLSIQSRPLPRNIVVWLGIELVVDPTRLLFNDDDVRIMVEQIRGGHQQVSGGGEHVDGHQSRWRDGHEHQIRVIGR